MMVMVSPLDARGTYTSNVYRLARSWCSAVSIRALFVPALFAVCHDPTVRISAPSSKIVTGTQKRLIRISIFPRRHGARDRWSSC